MILKCKFAIFAAGLSLMFFSGCSGFSPNKIKVVQIEPEQIKVHKMTAKLVGFPDNISWKLLCGDRSWRGGILRFSPSLKSVFSYKIKLSCFVWY